MTDANRRVTASLAALDPAQVLANAAVVLAQHNLAQDPWTTDLGIPIEPTRRPLAAYLGEVLAARERGEARPSLLTSGPMVLVAEPDTVWFPLPPTTVDACMALIDDLTTAVDAYHAHVEDDRFLLLYQSHRATERARAAVPEEYRHYIPEPPESDDLPHLLVPEEYDTRCVPPGVWWVNYWDTTQLATIGEDRVRAAPWARLRQAARGGLLLAATEEPTDLAHVTTLRELVADLRLPALQERHRR
ncbi:DUF5953 family protein [Actinokineospora enzanensis]|uniref:DUF5953 family protein n=1 Tax=Actinokineospora enzanensis TaxID=155975 RepID=UPI00037FC7B7|nr:DUF5953 family protein [Actinokineospora enzanensis]